MRRSSPSLPRATLALVLVPVLMSVALVATLTATWLSVRDVAVILVRGQGDTILDALTHAPGGHLDDGLLDAMLAEQGPEGLRCIAVFTPAGELRRVVGQCLSGDAGSLREALLTSGADAVEVGGRIRMSRGRPNPDGAVGGREPVLIEFEPVTRRQLEHDSLRALGAGGVASLALLLVSFGLWRFSVRRQRLEATQARDRHLASLGEMAAVLAHEIRNPLAAMKGHAQLLHERLPEGSPERDKADRVAAEAVRLENLLGDLLAFVRCERVERAPVDPRAVLAAAAADVAADRIDLETDRAPGTFPLDERLIRQALVNLLRNAVQASPDDARVSAGAAVENGLLIFTVRDRGEGLPAVGDERIFEPFFTTRVRGTGLGLAVARRIVELHRGSVSAANHPEGGAVFRVTVPES